VNPENIHNIFITTHYMGDFLEFWGQRGVLWSGISESIGNGGL